MVSLTNSANNSGLATCIELNIHIHLSQPLDTGSHFWSDDGCHGSFVEKDRQEKDALNYHAWPGPFFSLTFQLLCYQSQNGKVLITLHGGTCLHETHKQTHRRVTLHLDKWSWSN